MPSGSQANFFLMNKNTFHGWAVASIAASYFILAKRASSHYVQCEWHSCSGWCEEVSHFWRREKKRSYRCFVDFVLVILVSREKSLIA